MTYLKKHRMAAIILPMALSSCSQLESKFTCGSDDAKQTVLGLIKENLEKSADERTRDDDGSSLVFTSDISAAISQITMSIENIRTTKKDPNSTMQSCSGTLKLVYPLDMIKDAETTRSLAKIDSINDILIKSDITRKADAFETGIDYNIQPTDDKKNIYAEADNIDDKVHTYAEIISSYLLKPRWERMKRENAQNDVANASVSYPEWQADSENVTNEN